jgi:hypothetical protein
LIKKINSAATDGWPAHCRLSLFRRFVSGDQAPLFYIFQDLPAERPALAILCVIQMPLDPLVQGRIFWHLVFAMPVGIYF